MKINDYVRSVNGEVYGDIDRYRVERLIGSGASGKVYEVYSEGKRYAMKVPLMVDPKNTSATITNIGRDLMDSCKSEAEHWSLLTDECPDSVIRFRDYNVEPFPWMVMEYGTRDFKSHMESGKATVGDVIVLLRKLQRIHDCRIVHRDIKPENIMFADGQWKFTDFGLSKSIGSLSGSSGLIKGTPEYMAPEQVSPRRFGTVDRRTDLWQMGILLYRVIMKVSPYYSDDIVMMTAEIVNDGPDLSRVPAEYSEIFKKAFSKEREKRYSSAKEFAEDLESKRGAPCSPQETAGDGLTQSDECAGPRTIDFPNGDVYVGEAKNGIPCGEGTYTCRDGRIMEGRMEGCKLNGKGTVTMPNGNKYIGDYKDGVLSEGTIEYADGGVYRGGISDWKRNGEGRYKWPNGDLFEGRYSDGERVGTGRYSWSDGSKFEGTYVNGKKEGHGVLTESNGNVTSGTWHNGKLVKKDRQSLFRMLSADD